MILNLYQADAKFKVKRRSWLRRKILAQQMPIENRISQGPIFTFINL